MRVYKVMFDENKATSASQIDFFHYENMKIEQRDGQRVIRWLTIFADDERESILVANKIVKDIGVRNTNSNILH